MDQRLVRPVNVPIIAKEDLGVRSFRFKTGLKQANAQLGAVNRWYEAIRHKFSTGK
jgi:hypothetical protein